MKPKELSRKCPECESFSAAKHILPCFLNIWHYHDEIELVYIKEGTGTRFIGDKIEKFEPGDLVMVGSQLPHLWLSDDIYFQKSDLISEAWVIYFHPDCFGSKFFDAPEMGKIQKLLESAKVGLKISGKSNKRIIKKIEQLLAYDNSEKIIHFLKILSIIANESEIDTLSSLSYLKSFNSTSSGRLDKVYNYVYKNFRNNISLNTVAEIANMNPSSFSRYFRQSTNKTFTQFVNEVRIGFACKLIIEKNDSNIAEIGFNVGFNNLSNFNKQFKFLTDSSPTQYKKKYMLNEVA